MLTDGRPGTGRRTSVLDLLEDGATGRGTVHFVGEEAEPTPMARLWADSELSARWTAAHIGTGGVVAAVLTNTRACVATLFGAWRAGCTVASLPLPARGMSPEIYGAQLARFCAAAGARTLLVDPEHAPLIGDVRVPVHTHDETQRGGPPSSLEGNGALVQFTSGSVSSPKGIYLTLDAVGTNVEAIVRTLDPELGDSSCSWLPLSHDMGLIGQLLSPLAASAAHWGHHNLTLMKPETFAANPRSWLRTCSEKGSTITCVPNFALDLAVRTNRRMGALDLSRLRTIIVGSESVKRDTLERFTESFAPAGFRPIAFSPGYGMAEATLAVTIVPPDELWHAVPRPSQLGEPGGAPRSLVSCGRAVTGVDVRVAGSSGSVGPIEFRSVSMLSHYIGSELRLTDDGYLVTGDIGMMQDDELYVVGRGDDAIVVAGHVVYADDIEVAVDHESIRPSCIAAVAAPDGGLAIVAEPAAPRMSTAELEDACRAIRRVVAGRTGWPTATVAFVARGSLPKTPSGKLRRLAIARLLSTDELLARVDFA